MKTPTLPKLEREPTNDTAALTCYALEWRERAISAECINAELLAALEICAASIEHRFGKCHELSKASAAIAKAKGKNT